MLCHTATEQPHNWNLTFIFRVIFELRRKNVTWEIYVLGHRIIICIFHNYLLLGYIMSTKFARDKWRGCIHHRPHTQDGNVTAMCWWLGSVSGARWSTNGIWKWCLCSSEMGLRENIEAIYFTVIIATIITAPRNNDSLCWRKGG